MAGFVEGINRSQSTLFPALLDDYGGIDNPVRAVDASTVEHPFATIKCLMGATHFLCTTRPKVATDMALNGLAYNMKRVMTILGVRALADAMRA